jgi:hypothetical protein
MRIVAAIVAVAGAAQLAAGTVVAVFGSRDLMLTLGAAGAAVGLALLVVAAVLVRLARRVGAASPVAPLWTPNQRSNGTNTSGAEAASATWALVDRMREEATQGDPERAEPEAPPRAGRSGTTPPG